MSEKVDKILKAKSKLGIKHDGFGRLFFEEPEYNVNCKKCGTLYKADTITRQWEMNPKYKGICWDCYVKLINENPSEKQLREWAEETLNSKIDGYNYVKPYDCNYSNFEKVQKLIPIILKEREDAKEKAYHLRKIKEASKIIDDVRLSRSKSTKKPIEKGNISYDTLVDVVAKLLEKIDEVEGKIPPRDILHERFTI